MTVSAGMTSTVTSLSGSAASALSLDEPHYVTAGYVWGDKFYSEYLHSYKIIYYHSHVTVFKIESQYCINNKPSICSNQPHNVTRNNQVSCSTVLQYYTCTDISMECVLNVLLSNGN